VTAPVVTPPPPPIAHEPLVVRPARATITPAAPPAPSARRPPFEQNPFAAEP
jgi:hypothetical protein